MRADTARAAETAVDAPDSVISRQPPSPAIDLVGVSKRFGAVAALQEVSLTVDRGTLVGLIGPDGAGKTTAIRVLCGLTRPDAGRVRVLDLDPGAAHRTLASQVGYLSQRFALYGDLTVDENLTFFAELHGVAAESARKERLLTVTGLTPVRRRLAAELSGGMKQKLALACTLVHEPALLLLDEPTTGVDPVSRRELWKLLWDLVADGVTIVLATPYLEEAERCARVAFLHEGRLVAFDDPAALKARFDGEIVEVMTGAVQAVRDVLGWMLEGAELHAFGDRVHVRVAAGEGAAVAAAIARQLAAAGVAAEVRRGAPSLEDVFIQQVTLLAAGRRDA